MDVNTVNAVKDVAIEVANNSTQDVFASTIKWVAIAVIVVCITIITIKYIIPLIKSEIVKTAKVTKADLVFYKNMLSSVSDKACDTLAINQYISKELVEANTKLDIVGKNIEHMEESNKVFQEKTIEAFNEIHTNMALERQSLELLVRRSERA